ncbi:MAG: hypothetical protein V4596_02015 [Bdellovibrionota bacterium]
MKKQFLLLQILIFALVQTSPMQVTPAYSADGTRSDSQPGVQTLIELSQKFKGPPLQQQTTEAVVVKAPVDVPTYFKPKIKELVFEQKYRDAEGKLITVKGLIERRVGATLGKEIRRTMYEIFQEYGGDVEFIVTTKARLEDAEEVKKIVEEEYAKKNIKTKVAIFQFPQWIEDILVQQAVSQAQGKIQGMAWKAKYMLKKISQPQQTANEVVEITKNQYEKPTSKDIKIAVISAALTAAISYSGGVYADPDTVMIGLGVSNLSLALVAIGKALFVGTAAAYNKTLGNILKTDIFNEFNIMSPIRRVFSEAFFAIGSSTATSFSGVSASDMVNTASSALVESATNVEKDMKLRSQKAQDILFYTTFILGNAVSLLGAMGITGPMIYEGGFVQLSTLHASAVSVFTAIYIALKYKSHTLQRLAEEAYINKITKIANQKLAQVQKGFRYKPSQFTRPATCGSLFQ